MRLFVRTIVATLLLVWSNAAMAQNNVIDEVAWVVGDEAIWKSEVEEARLSALYEGRKFDKDPYCVLPEEMAVQKLFLHQAELDSIEVSDAEVLQRVDYMTNMYIQNIGSREKMEEYFNKTITEICCYIPVFFRYESIDLVLSVAYKLESCRLYTSA